MFPAICTLPVASQYTGPLRIFPDRFSVTPAAMLFVPTIGGLSHCETEDAPWDDIAKATDVLLTLVSELASG